MPEHIKVVKERITVYIPKAKERWFLELEKIAVKRDRSLGYMICEAVRAYVEGEDE